MNLKLEGVIPAMVTFFKPNYEVDEEAVRRQVDYIIEGGYSGVLACGSIGEFAHMTRDERKKVAQLAVDQANGRVPIVIGLGSTSTEECIDLGKHAKDIGADALLLQPPYYYKYDEDTLFKHYKEVAEKADHPLIIYNNIFDCSIDLSPELIARMAEKIENIVGIKNTTNKIVHIQRVIHLTRNLKKSFTVFGGSDDLLLPTMLIGGHGAVTGVGNVWREPANIYKAIKKNDLEEARKIHDNLIATREFLFTLTRPLIPVFKAALCLMGRADCPYVRMPMQSLSKEKQDRLKEKLIEQGLIK